jgi:hypothetical protein
MAEIDRAEGQRAFGIDPTSYDQARPDYPPRVYEILRDCCGLQPGVRTFEIGPGSGVATRHLLRLGAAPLVVVEPDERLASFLTTTLGQSVSGIEVKSPRLRTPKKPNILVIMGDDIGWFNPSIYHRGMMGYQTPNIDRIAKEGAMFTDWYGQQSCTAGHAAFITGQSPIRTGLTKVGLPGADIGLRPEDPTIAEILKPLGYATGQFGKNHLGDKDEFLPTNHGFDEFFGNLYHSMLRKSRRTPNTRKILSSIRGSVPAASSNLRPMARSRTPAR